MTSLFNWSASTSIRASIIQSKRSHNGAAGKLRPLCVFDDTRMPYKAKVTETMSWNDIPTCKESGVPTDYVMLRGIFMPGGVTKEQVDYYVDLFKKVRETPEWKKFMEDGAFNQTFMTGPDYAKWVEKTENTHRELMQRSGLPRQALVSQPKTALSSAVFALSCSNSMEENQSQWLAAIVRAFQRVR